MKFIDLIPNICEGFPFNRGNFVLLNFWGDNKDLEILDLFAENLSKKGIVPMKHHCSNRFFEKTVLSLIRKEQGFPEEYFCFLSSFEYVVDIFMYPPKLPEGISKEEIPDFQKYLGELFNSLTENKKYYIQLNVPTEINAAKAGMDYEIFNSSMCNALNINYQELKKTCKEKVESLKGMKGIEIITGNKYVLKLDIESRNWFIDDGCGDFPSGEVYIAPIENCSFGELIVPLVKLKGKSFTDVILTFEGGKLINTSSQEINDFFKALPEQFKILCEFGIGLNPNIKEITGYTLFDEKALGTYHIGLGMNHFFGGENNCPFHMDFVFKCNKVVFSE